MFTRFFATLFYPTVTEDKTPLKEIYLRAQIEMAAHRHVYKAEVREDEETATQGRRHLALVCSPSVPPHVGNIPNLEDPQEVLREEARIVRQHWRGFCEILGDGAGYGVLVELRENLLSRIHEINQAASMEDDAVHEVLEWDRRHREMLGRTYRFLYFRLRVLENVLYRFEAFGEVDEPDEDEVLEEVRMSADESISYRPRDKTVRKIIDIIQCYEDDPVDQMGDIERDLRDFDYGDEDLLRSVRRVFNNNEIDWEHRNPDSFVEACREFIRRDPRLDITLVSSRV